MKKAAIALAATMLLAGATVLSYPLWGNWLATGQQGRQIQAYISQIEGMDQAEIERIWKQAVQYNANRSYENWLAMEGVLDDAVTEEYLDVLNVGDSMGHLEIPKIGISLPIYHGVADQQIRIGAGHLPWSGLPIGGEGNHCVLTSHSALASARLFTDLVEVEQEDIFYIYTLDQTLAYQVDQILIVAPDEIDALAPEDGKDYVTLITCTPYAINSHRLLVRGTRIEYSPEEPAPVSQESPNEPGWPLYIGIAVVMAGLLLATGVCVHKKRKKARERRRQNRIVYKKQMYNRR